MYLFTSNLNYIMYLNSRKYKTFSNSLLLAVLVSGLFACTGLKHSGQVIENDDVYFNSKDRKEVDEYARVQANLEELRKREQQMLSESNLMSSRTNETTLENEKPEISRNRLYYDTTYNRNTRLFIPRHNNRDSNVNNSRWNNCNCWNWNTTACNCWNIPCNGWSSWNTCCSSFYTSSWRPNSLFFSFGNDLFIGGNWWVFTWGRVNRWNAWNSWNTWNTWNSWNSPYWYYSRREMRRANMTNNPVNTAPRSSSSSINSNSSSSQRPTYSNTTGRTYSSNSGRSYSSGASSSGRSSSGSSSRSSSGSSSRPRR
ncbi:MAG: hypothetical protein NZ551_04435 [Microscillaceae bacterium]|nr:hypothetical protein [Microscillaceae bacterium]MDW8460439.1 hypothetical protein [Cytophagales bacterium]